MSACASFTYLEIHVWFFLQWCDVIDVISYLNARTSFRLPYVLRLNHLNYPPKQQTPDHSKGTDRCSSTNPQARKQHIPFLVFGVLWPQVELPTSQTSGHSNHYVTDSGYQALILGLPALFHLKWEQVVLYKSFYQQVNLQQLEFLKKCICLGILSLDQW